MIKDLTGKRFRRNKYGNSIWEDKIKEVTFTLSLQVRPEHSLRRKNISEYMRQLRASHSLGFKVKTNVMGYNTKRSYDLDEIIVFND